MNFSDLEKLAAHDQAAAQALLGVMAAAFAPGSAGGRSATASSSDEPGLPDEAEEGAMLIDERWRILSADEPLQRMLGPDLVGREVGDVLGRIPSDGHPFDVGERRLRARRHDLPLASGLLRLLVVRDDGGRLEASRHAESRFRLMVEQIPAVLFLAPLEEGPNELYVSPQVETMLGYTQEEWLSDPVLWFSRLHPDDRAMWTEEFARGCASGGPFRAECRFLARDGRVVWVHGEARIVRDAEGRPSFLQGVAFDITESKEAAARVEAALHEKEAMLREIHHRVMNNQQVTCSLLDLQAANQREGQTIATALRESRERVRSIALVHEKLYRSDDLSRIDFGAYANSLVHGLAASLRVDRRQVRVEVWSDDVFLDLDTAVPCGMILNELISNSFRHAFPPGRAGRVEVRLRDGEMEVVDDGVGLPAGLEWSRADTLGFQLVAMFAAKIQGQVEITTAEKTRARVRSPLIRLRRS